VWLLSEPTFRWNVGRIGELGTMLAVTSNGSTLRRNTKYHLSNGHTTGGPSGSAQLHRVR
jgi:hypothetical protein